MIKHLNHTGWKPPLESEHLDEYHVLVDDKLSVVVARSKLKAVVENIYHDKVFVYNYLFKCR